MYDIMSIEGGIFMDPMNTIVAKNIKRLREEKKLSMEELSKLSSVSKSMLAQIERGEGNPTLSTLWKISNGMKVPFDALTVRPERVYEIVKTSEVQPLLEDSGKVKNYSIFPDDENRRFAVYYLELEEGSYWEQSLLPYLRAGSSSGWMGRRFRLKKERVFGFGQTIPIPTGIQELGKRFCI